MDARGGALRRINVEARASAAAGLARSVRRVGMHDMRRDLVRSDSRRRDGSGFWIERRRMILYSSLRFYSLRALCKFRADVAVRTCDQHVPLQHDPADHDMLLLKGTLETWDASECQTHKTPSLNRKAHAVFWDECAPLFRLKPAPSVDLLTSGASTTFATWL